MKLTPAQRFWRLLKQYKSELRQIYIYAIFIGIVNLTLPLGIQAIINYLQVGEVTSSWMILVFFVIGGIAITGALQILQLRVVENIQQDLFSRSAFEFAFRIPQITFLQLDKVHAPELVNRFFDTLTLQKGLPKILIDFSLALFQVFFGLLLLNIYSPYFVILGFALGLIILIVFKITGPKGLKTSIKESKFKYNLLHWLEEVARVSRSFKLNSKYNFHLKKADDIVTDYLGFREKHFKVLFSQFQLFIAFKIIVAAGLLLLGGYLVFDDQMNIGQFVAAEIIVLLIINSVEKIINSIDTVYDVLTGLEKIGDVSDLELEKNNGTANLATNQGLSIKAKDIYCHFGNLKKKVIKETSFEILANEKVVLSGKSGTGKSLLLQILSGIHQVDGGELYLNNIPYNNYEREQLYDSFGVAFPTNQIFEGTYNENIFLGRKIPEKDQNEIFKLLELDNYFSMLPNGMETIVDSGGRRLRRSIIQKLLVARILVNKPKLLLMEDPLHFMEDEDKIKIIDYIMDSKQPWTVLVVSDFYYWKEKCDREIELIKN